MKKAFHAGFAVFLVLAASGPSRAQTLWPSHEPPAQSGGATPAPGPAPDLAFGAYQRGFFITALREAMRRVAANPKDAAAMTLIGEIYRDGCAVRQDMAEAARWYRLASGLGDREAAFALGTLLVTGAPGIDKDRAGAKAQFEIAAAKGQAGALYNLGVMAIQGDATTKPDFTKAADYFRRAAIAGDDNGAYSYGVLLREGRGVPLDIGEAAHWLKRAADGGIIAGQVEYAIMLFNGVGVEKNEAAAAQLFLIAAARNNPIAQNRLAHLYATGRGVPRDLVEAATWNRFAKAAGIDDPELDAATAKLTPAENERVDQLVRRQAAF
ncbi:MAG: tetratricopeptide repeat protein [Roseiarcus sp.]